MELCTFSLKDAIITPFCEAGGVPADTTILIPPHLMGWIASGAIDGLVYLHHNVDMLHGNMKTSNLLVGTDGHVKLGGLTARVLEAFSHNRDRLNSSRFDERFNYICYMPPERIQGNQEHSSVAYGQDVWGLGVALVELGRLQQPFLQYEGGVVQQDIWPILAAIVDGPTPTLPEA
jgi:serine/threonine protein kinase